MRTHFLSILPLCVSRPGKQMDFEMSGINIKQNKRNPGKIKTKNEMSPLESRVSSISSTDHMAPEIIPSSGSPPKMKLLPPSSRQQEYHPIHRKLSFGPSPDKQWSVMKSHPMIPMIGLLMFGVIMGSGICIIKVLESRNEETLKGEALSLAKDTGRWFSDQLDRAMLPLFSLSQFVNELDEFQSLPAKIGEANQPGSAPLIPSSTPGAPPTHRNVSGICDDPVVANRFKEIAANIKRQAKMEGILVNLQLAPRGVVCLLHPLNNTEDFEDGVFMDNSGAWGHDLLSDPARRFIAEATIASDKPVTAGPLQLRQCKSCDPTVEKAFITRLPIERRGHFMEVNGRSYDKWGFAVALVNWEELIKRSRIYDLFAAEHLEFQLTRTDRVYDPEAKSYTDAVVVLANTPGFERTAHLVSTPLQTTNNEWELTVSYQSDAASTKLALLSVYLAALGIAFLVHIILIQKQIHSDTLAETSALMLEQAQKAAAVERDLNDYIAHEVRNPLAAAISACSFVASAVLQTENLTSKDIKKSVEEDVAVIEVSLHFVNDLLRSMLDLSRAMHNQLVLEKGPVDVLSDILQPVAAMLYGRDSMFEVLLQCPENLVIMTDRLRLKQIVLNLGRNASKFVEQGFVRLRADVVGGLVNLYVEDSGPGIPKEKRGKLFDKFQESLDVMSQGTGIGLSLCHRLIGLMGGEIRLDDSYVSGVDRFPGARFVIELKVPPLAMETLYNSVPEVDAMENSTETSTVSSGSTTGTDLPEKLKVLFVDDDMMLRKLFVRSLRMARPNWEVHQAACGEAALGLVDSQEFDIIFLDQYMTSAEKQLLGTETVRALRAKGCQSVICGLSANDMEVPFRAAGANAFVMKPFPCKEEPMLQELTRILFSGETLSANFASQVQDEALE